MSAGNRSTLKKDHERVGEVWREVEEGFDPLHGRERRGHYAAEELCGRLHRPLRPTVLLRANALTSSGSSANKVTTLSRWMNFHSGELRAVGEIEVLGQRVVLPAAARPDGLLAPHPARPREVEEPTGGRSCAVFDEVMSVEHQRLRAREERVRRGSSDPSGPEPFRPSDRS